MSEAAHDETDGAHGRLLFVEDDAAFLRVMARALSARGFTVDAVATLSHAFARAAARDALDYAVLDLNLAGESSLPLVAALHAAHPDCRIVVLTGFASIATAVKAIKLGAAEYLAKPVEADALARVLLGVSPEDSVALSDAPLTVSQLEWEHIQRVLADHEGNISATARALRMHRRTLQRKLAKRPDAPASR
jgi:two-component system response regulator RegA